MRPTPFVFLRLKLKVNSSGISAHRHRCIQRQPADHKGSRADGDNGPAIVNAMAYSRQTCSPIRLLVKQVVCTPPPVPVIWSTISPMPTAYNEWVVRADRHTDGCGNGVSNQNRSASGYE